MSRNMKKAVLMLGVLCLASIGGVSAYLTDYDKADNQFTVGKVEIELQEPKWNPEDHSKIEPGKEIPKDPQIRNTGVNDAFVYLEVSVPMAEVTAADQEGNRLERKMQELFSYQAGENWTKLKSETVEDNMIYVYAYNEILEPEETTEPLFETMHFLNVIEGQLDMQQLSVPVRAYAIQTAYTGDGGETAAEQARAAYEKYVNQNREQEGRTTA
ncbi:MAG TPA: SipW-dependent-type signal peptide-containing protein [Candidatus Blautia intestinipullorum]|nr:SipW-dependent-type signal peptide-containing protein [Candidatus Blautia intestinipullorum]